MIENFQVLEYESSGITLGIFKSINESLTRVAVYISLMALYCLGGSKVKAVRTSTSFSESYFHLMLNGWILLIFCLEDLDLELFT